MKFKDTRTLLDSLDAGADNDIRAHMRALESAQSFRQALLLPSQEALDFRASDDAGNVRVIMSAISLFEEFGVNAHFAGFDEERVPQFYVSADDGSIYAAAGKWILGQLGVNVTGVDFLENHTAVVGAYTRTVRRGFQSISGKPVYYIEFIGGAGGSEIITSNPRFESGDFTGFTVSDTLAGEAWEIIASGAYSGTYRAKFSFSSSGTATIITNKYAVTAANRYMFSVYVKCGELTNLAIKMRWYDAGSALLQTDIIYDAAAVLGSWTKKYAVFEAPTGATQCDIHLVATGDGVKSSALSLDDFSILPLGEYAAFELSDNGAYAITAAGRFDLTDLVSGIPDASTTVKGIVELATSAETITGTDTERAVTPAGLQAKVTSATVKGIVELATDAETITGTDTERAVTPAGLQAKVTSATVKGIVELATDAETITGTDTERAVTPAGLQAKVTSATVKGIVELATDAETITGTDTERAVTPAGLQAKVASLTVKGIVELATSAEIDTGTDSTRAIPVDQFVASARNVRYVFIRVVAATANCAVGTSVAGDWECPFAGTITEIGAFSDTAGITNLMTVDVNKNSSTLMTTNKITLDSAEKTSRTAATAPGLTTTSIAAGDILTIDIDGVQTTPAKGLVVRIGIRQS